MHRPQVFTADNLLIKSCVFETSRNLYCTRLHRRRPKPVSFFTWRYLNTRHVTLTIGTCEKYSSIPSYELVLSVCQMQGLKMRYFELDFNSPSDKIIRQWEALLQIQSFGAFSSKGVFENIILFRLHGRISFVL